MPMSIVKTKHLWAAQKFADRVIPIYPMTFVHGATIKVADIIESSYFLYNICFRYYFLIKPYSVVPYNLPHIGTMRISDQDDKNIQKIDPENFYETQKFMIKSFYQ